MYSSFYLSWEPIINTHSLANSHSWSSVNFFYGQFNAEDGSQQFSDEKAHECMVVQSGEKEAGGNQPV